MQDERRVLLDLDELRQILLLRAHVDERVPVVVEDAEETVDPHVHARRLEQLLVVGLDHDATLAQEAGDRPIRENHAGSLWRTGLHPVPSRPPRAAGQKAPRPEGR